MKTIMISNQNAKVAGKGGFTDRCVMVKPTMSERAEQITKDLDLEAKLRFYENWAVAVINGYFVFSDGSEIKVPVK